MAGWTELLVHTGQHYDEMLSKVFFEELDLPAPIHHLNVGSAPHGEQTGRMLAAVERVLLDERPDLVLVYGDTNSTLAGALAAAKLRIPIAHVEAGLRSFDRGMPEEVNRVLTDHLADLLFTPTATATANLRSEGFAQKRIHEVGDVMFDVALLCAKAAACRSTVMARLQLDPGRYLLCTIHRAENTDDGGRLRAIVEGLEQVAGDVPVVFPLHPRTHRALEREGLLPSLGPGLRMIEPVGYLDMTVLEQHARLIATDSGGVQKEAFFYGVPCVTLRERTEWTELVDAGWNHLVAPESAVAVAVGLRQGLTARERRPIAPYGSGDAAFRITRVLLDAGGDRALGTRR
jgi:UDP-GlcNAc3NAcA epimerase